MKTRSIIFICIFIICNCQLVYSQLFPHPDDVDLFQMRANFWNGYEGQMEHIEDSYIDEFRRFENFWMPRVCNHNGNLNVAAQANEDYLLNENYLENISCKPASWTNLGPSGNGLGGIGRVNCISFDLQDNDAIYCGTPNGGVWKYSKTNNMWNVLNTDNQLARLGVSDIVVDPFYNSFNNKPYIFVGTGDSPHRVSYSGGVYRSSDGGTTWNAINGGALVQITGGNYIVFDLLVDPSNSNIMYAATSIGIFRCNNRQSSHPWWNKVYPASGNESVTSINFDPTSNGQIIYASGVTVIKSIDQGITWNSIATPGSGLDLTGYPIGTPAFPNHCILGSENYIADNNKMYVLFIAQEVQCHSVWNLCALYYLYEFDFSSQQFLQKSYIYGSGCDLVFKAQRFAFAVSPTNPNLIYGGNVYLYGSSDGGSTWSLTNNCAHVDYHDIKYDPFDNNVVYFATDGGMYKKTLVPSTCLEINNGLEISTVYNFATSKQDPYQILLGCQDDGAKYIKNGTFKGLTYTDAFEELIDFTDTRNMLSTGYSNLWKNTGDDINPIFAVAVQAPQGSAFATAFNIVQDPVQNTTVYQGRHDLWKNTNFSYGNSNFNSNTWTQLSDFQNPLYGYNVSPWQDVQVVKVSHSNPNVIYVVLRPNWDPLANSFYTARIFKTSTGGGFSSWVDLTPSGLTSEFISDLEVSQFDPDHFWVSFSGYTNNKKVRESINGSWIDHYIGLPNFSVNCLEYEYGSNDGLYAGTEVGVYYKNKAMPGWMKFTGDCVGGYTLPNTTVTELEINYGINKIRAATYGRGIWESTLACPDDYDLTISGSVNADEWQEANHDLFSTQAIGPVIVTNRAGNSIELNPGFIADALSTPNTVYKAFIHSCNSSYNSSSFQRTFIDLNEEEEETYDNKPSVVLFPNPAKDLLNVSVNDLIGNYKIEIYNSVGTLTQMYSMINQSMSEINLSNLKSGVYLVRIVSNEFNSISQKLIVY